MNDHQDRSLEHDRPLPEDPEHQRLFRLFESAWESAAPLKLEEVLEQAPPAERSTLLRFLLPCELAHRAGRGERVAETEYMERFPDFVDTVKQILGDQQTQIWSDPASDGKSESADRDRTPRRPADDESTLERIGRYDIQRVLGEGTFGRVVLAHDSQLERLVAIKVPHPQAMRDEVLESFLHEARIAAQLRHPSLVAVFDVQSEDGRPFIVQEYIAGQNLADWSADRETDVRQIVELMIQVTAAVGAAHAEGLIHRDLKPANILVDPSDVPHVADFGLALHESARRKHIGEMAGTPAYMSPEQVRGESHRLDGRTDLWSLGVILYELLAGRRPFPGSMRTELFHQIKSQEPTPPRHFNHDISRELERICLRCLEKRTDDRYPTAEDLLQDLQLWLEREKALESGAESTRTAAGPRIVPKGLRAFDEHDSDFFIELLPGPRDREGLPGSIRFWKSRIEQQEADRTFRVGLMYGPSGCGKSSLVNAGLVPRLANHIEPVYVEASAADTEARLLKALRRAGLDLPTSASLSDCISALRDDGKRRATKILIVLDQFEQWLHGRTIEERKELAEALRQCDGAHVQALILVRGDYYVGVSRFFHELEEKLVEGQNLAMVDLFDPDHARRVLAAFGRAYGKLPENDLTPEQTAFLDSAVDGLAEDGKVISVQLAVLAEMMKGRPWDAASLRAVGGTKGVGVTFLDETFSAKSAPPGHRLHEDGIRAVLRGLLPQQGTDIKGRMQPYHRLLRASGYEGRGDDFDELLSILDQELRLITPAERAGDGPGDVSTARDTSQLEQGAASDADEPPHESRYYQLTHDYLVPSIREWLTRKQKETRRGRAELRLDARTAEWKHQPESRHLPSLFEFANILAFTSRSRWTGPQKQMMRRAGRLHGVRWSLVLGFIAALVVSGAVARQRVRQGDRQRLAQRLVAQILTADIANLESPISQLESVRELADPLLAEHARALDDTDPHRLNVSLALLESDTDAQVEFLVARLASALPDEVRAIRQALADTRQRETTVEELWAQLLEADNDTTSLLPLAATLAWLDEDDPRWQAHGAKVANALVRTDAVYLGGWLELLQGVRDPLLPSLTVIYSDRSDDSSEAERNLATSILRRYATDRPATLAELLAAGDPEQFLALFPLAARPDNVSAITSVIRGEISRRAVPDWGDQDASPDWESPSGAVIAALEVAHGMLDEENRFAFCLKMPWVQFQEVPEELRPCGFRPTRVRPFASDAGLFVAAVWTRDGASWDLKTDLKIDDLPDDGPVTHRNGLIPVDVAAYTTDDPVQDASTGTRYLLVWGPAVEDELRQLRADLTLTQLREAHEALREESSGLRSLHISQSGDGERRYAGIWSDTGEPGLPNPAYGGWELLDLPQIDISGLGPEVESNPADRFATVLLMDSKIESRLVESVPLSEHGGPCRELIEQGYRPVGVTVTLSTEGQELVASTAWNRPVIPLAEREALTERQANAAVALLRLGSPDEAWQLLHDTPDPQLRSYVLHRLASLEADPETLWRRYLVEEDSSARRALLLSLGRMASAGMIDQELQDEITTSLLDTFREDPDAGIHGATAWCLRQLGREEEIEAIRQALATGDFVGDRRWYITRTNLHTMVLVNAAEPFLMGSPITDNERYGGAFDSDEGQHRRLIGRTYALSAYEVTIEQFEAFLDDYNPNRDISRHDDAPATKVHWYRAMAYCNWLSERESLPRDQWCYDPDQELAEGSSLYSDHLQRTGYRLLTEAEWEYACRAGVGAARHFGDSRSLLEHYAWYRGNSPLSRLQPVGSLMPNGNGCFDMLGNAWEWCLDNGDFYPMDLELVVDQEQTEPIRNSDTRVLRGGCVTYGPPGIRSAFRTYNQPTGVNDVNSFRIGRTIHSMSRDGDNTTDNVAAR